MRARGARLRLAEHPRQQLGQRRQPRREALDRRLDVERPRQVAEQPARRALEQDPPAQEHRDLRPGRDEAVERLDLRPQRAERVQLARRRERARDVVGRRTGLVPHPEHERRAAPVHELVRHLRDHDLPAQRMPAQLVAEALAHLRREVPVELAREHRLVGQRRGEQVGREPELGVREQHRELGRRQPAARSLALLEHLVGRQRLELAADRRSARGSGCSARAPRPSTPPARPTSRSPAPGRSCRAAPARRPRPSPPPAAGFAPPSSARRTRPPAPSRIFRLTSWSEVSTPAELSIASMLMRPPPSAYVDPGALREAEVAALADHLAAQVAARRRAPRRSPCRRPPRSAPCFALT